jgi:hypothetical protein
MQMIDNQRLNNPTKELAEQDFFELAGTDTPKSTRSRGTKNHR